MEAETQLYVGKPQSIRESLGDNLRELLRVSKFMSHWVKVGTQQDVPHPDLDVEPELGWRLHEYSNQSHLVTVCRFCWSDLAV